MRACRGIITLAATTVLAACTGREPSPPDSVSSVEPEHALSCASAITVAPLPEWAREGFTPPDQEARQVVGVEGQIIGVVFADPLRAPPVEGLGNKILWLVPPGVPRNVDPDDADDSPLLRIDASLNGTDLTVVRTVPGPGPSIIDMPRAGCWTFELAWAGHRDRLAVPYAAS